MSISYGQFCPIAKAAEVLGERWTILIIRELLLGTSRFSDFQRALSQISPTLLTKRLNQLVDDELVVKKSTGGKGRTDYYLTPAGRELEPIVIGLGEWGMRWARGQMSDDELDVELLMYDLQRRLDDTQMPGGRNVIRFSFHGLQKFANWWIVVDEGEKELCVESPEGEENLAVVTSVRTMAEIWAGDTDYTKAKREGRLALKGCPILSRSIGNWLRGSILAHVRPAEKPAASAVSGIS
ncbi:MAG: helix-turn-helix transcriptional regulator [Verrucomicrobiae bacterium]|nr:helix-turn-helix transcriptional regulator [Verrucomicrobiae bacterium]